MALTNAEIKWFPHIVLLYKGLSVTTTLSGKIVISYIFISVLSTQVVCCIIRHKAHVTRRLIIVFSAEMRFNYKYHSNKLMP